MAVFHRLVFRAVCAGSMAMLSLACGPDLLEPATSSVTGSWILTGPIPGFSQIRVEMVQRDGGRVEGSWSGLATKNCNGVVSCPVSGVVAGINTTLQVYLEIVGAGDFTGQLVSPTYLRGSIATPDRIAVELRR